MSPGCPSLNSASYLDGKVLWASDTLILIRIKAIRIVTIKLNLLIAMGTSFRGEKRDGNSPPRLLAYQRPIGPLIPILGPNPMPGPNPAQGQIPRLG